MICLLKKLVLLLQEWGILSNFAAGTGKSDPFIRKLIKLRKSCPAGILWLYSQKLIKLRKSPSAADLFDIPRGGQGD